MANAFGAEYRLKYHNRLNEDFLFFSRWCLKVKTKEGEIKPFIFNKAQEYLHRKVEEQISTTGRARVLILKGRQQGMSTYIGGRFYWRTTRLEGKSTFILSHQADTTEKLFGMVSRFQNNCPDATKLIPDIANQRRLVFKTGSEYYVGTAGNEDVGRGGTVQYLHASEAAFYQNAIGFSTGLLQSVPDAPGTEVFIESTAAGMDVVFYPMCMNALQGKGDYILIFIPWFWQTEYRRTPPEGFVKDTEEVELARIFELDDAQIYWRRLKIIELKDIALFYREYPCSVEEAFTVSGNSLIPPICVMQARKNKVEDNIAPLIIGVDPNDAGGPIGVVWRKGRRILKYKMYEGKKAMEMAGILAAIIDNESPAKMFLDSGNGYGVLDRLHDLGYTKIATGVSAAEGATEDTVYLNKRSEMGCALAQWFINGGVGIPDDDLLHKHLCCVPARRKTGSEKIKLEAKEKIISDTGIDPHLFDAAALTFAYPVSANGSQSATGKIKKAQKGLSPLKSVQRREHYQRGREAVGSATVSI